MGDHSHGHVGFFLLMKTRANDSHGCGEGTGSTDSLHELAPKVYPEENLCTVEVRCNCEHDHCQNVERHRGHQGVPAADIFHTTADHWRKDQLGESLHHKYLRDVLPAQFRVIFKDVVWQQDPSIQVDRKLNEPAQ